MKPEKLIIYQVLPRILTNTTSDPTPDGTLERNGSGKLNDYTPRLLKSLRDLGVNAIWFTGVIEMATQTAYPGIPADNPHIVKGCAGSPYAIKDYYDVAPSLAEDIPARRDEFRKLVKRVHRAGMKCIIDFVPNHTARCYHSDSAPQGTRDFGADDDITFCFSPSNDYYYITDQRFSPSFDISSGSRPYVEFPAKATGNDCFTAFPSRNDWYETVKLNYGKDYANGSLHLNPIPPVWMKMYDILHHWAETGIDGFRCDMVFMVPLDFWHWVIPRIKKDFPDLIFIGEIYDISLYRPFLDYGCFDYLYDKVGLYDTLAGIERRNVSAAKLTGCWQAVDGIGSRMLNFLENHDEVRFGSSGFSGNPANVIPHLVVSSMISTGPFMIYYGQELGESAHDNEGFAGDNQRTTIFDYWSCDTMRRWYNNGKCDTSLLTSQERWLRDLYSRVLNLCNSQEAVSRGGFFDLMYVNLRNPEYNPHTLFSFIRHTEGEKLLIVANFSDNDERVALNIPYDAFRICGIPEGEASATDLLTDTTQRLHLSPSSPLRLNVPRRNALVLKLNLS